MISCANRVEENRDGGAEHEPPSTIFIQLAFRCRRNASNDEAARTDTSPGSGTSVPSKGAANTWLKFCDSAVKSAVLTVPSKFASPSLQNFPLPPKLLAIALKSSALTLPSRLASPDHV